MVIAGSASASQVIAGRPDITLWAGLIIAALGAGQWLLIGLAERATMKFCNGDIFNLMADIERETKPSSIDCARWESEIIRIYADEPPYNARPGCHSR